MKKAYYEALDMDVTIIHEYKDADGKPLYYVHGIISDEIGHTEIGKPVISEHGNYICRDTELIFYK